VGAVLLAACSRPSVDEAPAAFGQRAEPDEIERQIPRDAEVVWEAALRVLHENQFQVLQQDHDKLGGDVTARRTAGNKVYVRVKQLQPKQTTVTVRLDPPDRPLSVQLQEGIAGAVGLGEATTGLFGGESEEGTYPLPLDQAVRVARQAFAELRLHVVDASRKESEAELKGRRADSTPVKVRMKFWNPRATALTFIVGASKSDDHRALLKSLRQEFERRVRQFAP
jgi:hypothetical protein